MLRLVGMGLLEMVTTYDRMRATTARCVCSWPRPDWLPRQLRFVAPHLLQGQVKVCSLGATHLLQGKVKMGILVINRLLQGLVQVDRLHRYLGQVSR